MRRLLFVLDLNGTLLHRLTKSYECTAAMEHPLRRTADCKVRGCSIFFRPGRAAFLQKLLQLGQVAVWTSALPKNAVPMVLQTFSGLLDPAALRDHDDLNLQSGLTLHKDLVLSTENSIGRLLFLWTQNDCTILPPSPCTQNKFKPLFHKDLYRLWQRFPEYNATNTIMIDDSQDKLAGHLDNLLCLEEYVVTDPTKDFTQDQTLYRLSEYLQCLVDALDLSTPSFDVRDHLKAHPFSGSVVPGLNL